MLLNSAQRIQLKTSVISDLWVAKLQVTLVTLFEQQYTLRNIALTATG